MEQVNKEREKEIMEAAIQVLDEYMLSVFIDRRIFMSDGVPARYVDGFIRYILRDTEENLADVSSDEFTECYQNFSQDFFDKVERDRSARKPGGDENDVMSPFEELEWKLTALCYTKRMIIESGADEEEVNKAFTEQARECQKYIDGLEETEFDRVTLRNVVANEMRRPSRLKDKIPSEEELREMVPEEGPMPEMPEELAQMFFGLSVDILEGSLEDLYITKRILVNDGMPEDEIDAYIAERAKDLFTDMSEMSEGNFVDYLVGLQAELEEIHGNQVPEELETYMDHKSLTKGMLDIIDEKIRALMVVTKGVMVHGVQQEEVMRAIKEKAMELDELYMNMDRDKFERTVVEKCMEAEE